MPRRRLTPARKAAIAKWQRAGAKARRSGGTPVGKSVLMVHFGSKEHINRVLARQAFRPHPYQSNPNHVFFTTFANRNDRNFRGRYGYGYSGVKVSVPRKAIKPDTDWPHPRSFMVDAKVLQGRRIRRLGRG